ncbi:ABC transporter permease [Bradyrhizobium erythrophlei]|uniref:ABC transporter permease n=1 Tax=Bradyrhizobium erythrophlei TaxID=1437360 RepID=UPI0035EA9963
MSADTTIAIAGTGRIPFVKFIPVLFLATLCVAFEAANRNFITASNLQNIILASSILLIVASASTFVILLGCVDLSVGAVVSLAGLLTAMAVPVFGTSVLLLATLVGLVVGLINGALHVGLRIPSFLVTLGTMTALGGVALLLNNGAPVPILDKNFVALASGTLFPGIPNIGLWAFACYAALVVVDRRSLFGRHVLAIGGGERVAKLIGIPVARRKIEAFALSGAAAGFAGALLVARLETAAVAMGDGINLQTIATIVIGGTFITGGVGSVARTLTGVLAVVVLANGLDILAVHPYYQTIIKSLMVLIAVVIMSERNVGILK